MSSKSPPRKWLYDRIKGTSKYGDSHPPCQLCRVPPPVGWCPSLLEENACCKVYGQIGCCAPTNEKARNWVIKVGFLFNVIAFSLTLFSCLAVSDNYGKLNAAAFSSGALTSNTIFNGTVHIEVGLRAAAMDVPNYAPVVLRFGEFCDLESPQLAKYLTAVMNATSCDACKQVSKSMVKSIFVSLASFIPTLSSDILRTYSNYDVNCQKFFSTLFALVSILSMLNTFLKYNNTCFAGFYDGYVYYDQQGNVIDDPTVQSAFAINFQWTMGTGLRALYAGTILKLVDIICNVIIPSPTITRDLKEQTDYEALGDEEDNKSPDDDIKNNDEEKDNEDQSQQ